MARPPDGLWDEGRLRGSMVPRIIPQRKHRVAHGHPARLLGQALAGGAVEGGLGAEVEGRGAGGCHADVELGEQEASGKGVLVRKSRHILV